MTLQCVRSLFFVEVILKKLNISFLFLFIILLFPKLFVVKAVSDTNTEYQTYVEIIMSSGKLLRDFTKEELNSYLEEINQGVHFYEVLVYPVNKNVKSTYITNTLFSVDNTSASTVEYSFSVQVETTNVVSFSSTVTVSSSVGGNIKKVKAEASAKTNIEYSEKNTTSIKEKRTMDIKVEPNSRAIIYLMGDITITNGVFSVYDFFINVLNGGYEFAILNTQYARLEKATIW